MNIPILEEQLSALSCAYPVDVAEDYSHIIVRDFETPPGYNRSTIDVRIGIPEDFPVSPPGLAPHWICLPEGLRFKGKKPKDYHPGIGPRGWAWWCFERIEWDPCRDDLITLIEILRATMTEQS